MDYIFPAAIYYFLLVFAFLLYKWTRVPFVEDLKKRFPVVNDEETFYKIRQYMRKKNGYSKLLKYFMKKKIVVDGMLTTEANKDMPFNVFARICCGAMSCCEKLQELLPTSAKEKFIVCGNRPTEDSQWNDKNAKSGSMSPWHKFLILKNTLVWMYFNVLVMGLGSKHELKECIQLLNEMKKVAQHVAKEAGIRNVGLFVHCYPHNSVQSLHIHMLDMDNVGHWYNQYSYKNMSLDDVILVFEKELKKLE